MDQNIQGVEQSRCHQHITALVEIKSRRLERPSKDLQDELQTLLATTLLGPKHPGSGIHFSVAINVLPIVAGLALDEIKSLTYKRPSS